MPQQGGVAALLSAHPEEVRMLRSIARSAVLEAARVGAFSETFRGVRVSAIRDDGADQAQRGFFNVHVVFAGGAVAMERCVVVAVDADCMEPNAVTGGHWD